MLGTPLRDAMSLWRAMLALSAALFVGCSDSSAGEPSDAGTALDGAGASSLDATSVLDAAQPFDASNALDGAPPSTSTRLDVNDVSVLFPFPGSAAEGDMLLGFASTGSGGPLLSNAHFAASNALVTVQPGLLDYASWRVVGFRFDPCGVDVEDGGCVAQLRLIAQVPTFAPDLNAFADQAIHLVYAIDPALVRPLELDLRALKAASPLPTSGVPLGVHPGLDDVGLASDYAKQVETFVLKYASDPALVRVAITILADEGPWFFTAANVEQGVFSPFVVPGTTSTTISLFEGIPLGPAAIVRRNDDASDAGLDDDDASDGGTADDATASLGTFGTLTPEPVGTDSVVGLLTAGTSATAFQAAVDSAFRLDNPDTTDDVFHVDCVSCHLASRELVLRAAPAPTAGDPNAFVPPPGFTSTPSATPADQAPYLVRAFGYDPAGTLGITARTVNESAKVAAQIEAQGP